MGNGPYGYSFENFKKICYNKRGIIIKALPQIKRTASYEAAPIYVILMPERSMPFSSPRF